MNQEQFQNWLREYRKSDAWKTDFIKAFNGNEVQKLVDITGIENYAAKVDNPAIVDVIYAINTLEQAGKMPPELDEVRSQLYATREANFASFLMDVPVEEQDQVMDDFCNDVDALLGDDDEG